MISNLPTLLLKKILYRPKIIALNQQLLIGRSVDDDNITFNPNNLYPFNKVNTSCVEKVLLEITDFEIEFLHQICIFKHNISDNVIYSDMFYEEGFRNA